METLTYSTIKSHQNEEGNIHIDIVRDDDGGVNPNVYKTKEELRAEAEEFRELNPPTEYFSRKDSDDLDHILVLSFDRQVDLVELAHRTGNIDDVAYENLKAKIEETSGRKWPENPPGPVQFAEPSEDEPSPAPAAEPETAHR